MYSIYNYNMQVNKSINIATQKTVLVCSINTIGSKLSGYPGPNMTRKQVLLTLIISLSGLLVVLTYAVLSASSHSNSIMETNTTNNIVEPHKQPSTGSLQEESSSSSISSPNGASVHPISPSTIVSQSKSRIAVVVVAMILFLSIIALVSYYVYYYYSVYLPSVEQAKEQARLIEEARAKEAEEREEENRIKEQQERAAEFKARKRRKLLLIVVCIFPLLLVAGFLAAMIQEKFEQKDWREYANKKWDNFDDDFIS